MSLKPSPIEPVPEGTARVARAAFRKGNPLLKLRDELGAIFADADFADLFPKLGQPGLPPVAAGAGHPPPVPREPARPAGRRGGAGAHRLEVPARPRARRSRLRPLGAVRVPLAPARGRRRGAAPAASCWRRARPAGLLKARGRQRTDSTRVLASIRALNRLELVGETLRAALNELATVAPDWLRRVAPKDWYGRYAHRVEDGRLPRAEAEREAYARTVGEDGFALLDLLDRPEAPEGLRSLPAVGVLRRVWERQFVREDGPPPGGGVRRRGKDEPQPDRGPGRVALRSRGALPHPLGHRLGRVPRPPHRNLRRRHGPPDHARDDDRRHRARGALHRGDPRRPGRRGPGAGRAPGGRGLRRRRAAGREPRGARDRPVRPAAAEPGLAGQGRGRLHLRPVRDRLGARSGRAARRASRRAAGAGGSTGGTARPTSRSGSARRTAPPARRGPCAPGPGRPGSSGCSRGRNTRR